MLQPISSSWQLRAACLSNILCAVTAHEESNQDQEQNQDTDSFKRPHSFCVGPYFPKGARLHGRNKTRRKISIQENKKDSKGRTCLKMTSNSVRDFYNSKKQEVGSDIKRLKERTVSTVSKATSSAKRLVESAKVICASTVMIAGWAEIASIASQVGTVVAVSALGVYFGTEALAIKIADKYFRGQLLNNTMDEAAKRSYKMLLLTIQSLLKEGKGEKEIIKYLGSLNGAQIQVYADSFNKAVKEAELNGGYRK